MSRSRGKRPLLLLKTEVSPRRQPGPDPGELMKELAGQYESWILEDILLEDILHEDALSKDTPIQDPPKHPKKYAWPDQVKGDDFQERRPKHRELPFLLDRFGSTTLARKGLSRIPSELWRPFERDDPGGLKK